MDKKYDYIVYGNNTEWCEVVNYDLNNLSNSIFVNDHVQLIKSNFLRNICKIHFSEQMNRFFQLPLKNIWYGFFHNFPGIVQENSVFLFYDWNKLSYDDGYHIYLRSKYKDCKLVFLFTNIVNKSGAYKNGYFNKLKDEFDLVITYEYEDASRYNFLHHPYLYSKYIDAHNPIPSEFDVFYIGHAKERLELIHDIYAKLTYEGLKCKFIITGVKEKDKLMSSDITYNEMIPYKKSLELMMRSKCILEIVQQGASTFTLRTQEAVIYNKKLITNNYNIKNEKFYNENYIQIIDKKLENFNLDFVLADNYVKYDERLRAVFSPKRLYERISDHLFKESDFSM